MTKNCTNPGTSVTAEVEAAAEWQDRVRSALAARKNKATDAEIVRLGKTLIRLEGAALHSMGRHEVTEPGGANVFGATLTSLSRG